VTAGTLGLHGLTRRFGDHVAVDDLSLEVGRGELLALIGASGSGKTTTLRMVAGYEQPDSGEVRIDGRDITGLPPQRRDFGMVFQHYALFPHMSVGENVAFGLEARSVPRRERADRARRALDAVGLGGAGARNVQSLSGGEQQRVALARALVIEPRVLLLDEPLSNLDPTLRAAMRDDLRATLTRLGVTALFVTHDQEDAFAVADRIALIRRGRLLQVGAPEDLYDRPASRAVAEFIGRSTLVPAMPAEGSGEVRAATIRLDGAARTVRAWIGADARPSTDGWLAVLRPDALEFTAPDTTEAWSGEVVTRRFAGAALVYHVRVGEVELEVFTSERDVRVGERVGVRIAREPVPIVAA
jgi:putative spermidine/putrescine transport system ATP-binding protein